MNNGMKRNTIIFGDDNSSSNIKKIDELIEKMSENSSSYMEVEDIKDARRNAIYFGERNVSFTKSADSNIKKIDALIKIKQKESNMFDSMETKKVIKKNTINFDKDTSLNSGYVSGCENVNVNESNDEVFDNYSKKYIKRGKINIKSDNSLVEENVTSEESSDLDIKVPQPLKYDSILVDDESDKVDVAVKNVDDNENKNLKLMLMVIIGLLVLVLFGILLILFR